MPSTDHFHRESMPSITRYCFPRYSIGYAAALSSVAAPCMMILSSSSGIGRFKPLASSQGAHPDIAFFVARRDHGHSLRVDWLDDRVRRRCQEVIDVARARYGFV